MSHFDTPDKKIHQGRNIKRFREMLGVKQEALAYELGDDWSQKRVSLLEQKTTVEKTILMQVAEILKIPVAAIENFDEDEVMNIIGNTFHDSPMTNTNNKANNISCTFNPIDKIMELYEEKIVLYERMIKEKEEIIVKMEQLIKEK